MFNGISQLGLIKKSLLLVLPLAASAVVWAGSAAADYGSGAVYQVELSTNSAGRHGGGVWLWIGLNADGTGDYAGSDCGHGGEGAALNALPNSIAPFIPPPYYTTITVPRAYGHYTGNDHAFLTLPSFLPVGGSSGMRDRCRCSG